MCVCVCVCVTCTNPYIVYLYKYMYYKYYVLMSVICYKVFIWTTFMLHFNMTKPNKNQMPNTKVLNIPSVIPT